MHGMGPYRMITLEEYKNELKEYDQMEIVDRLEITSEDLVDRFDDRVEDKYNEIEDDDEEDSY